MPSNKTKHFTFEAYNCSTWHFKLTTSTKTKFRQKLQLPCTTIFFPPVCYKFSILLKEEYVHIFLFWYLPQSLPFEARPRRFRLITYRCFNIVLSKISLIQILNLILFCLLLHFFGFCCVAFSC